MSRYRDDREALRARNEALEAELAALKAGVRPAKRPARWGRALRVAVPLSALCGLGFTAYVPEGARVAEPMPEVAKLLPVRTSPRLIGEHPLKELYGAKGGAMEPTARKYSAVVTRASSGAPVKEQDACQVGLRRAGDVCFVDVTCGGWSPFPSGAVAACSIDDQGFPRGGIHLGQTTGQPTQITMDGTRFEVGDERPGKAYLVTMKLEDVVAG